MENATLRTCIAFAYSVTPPQVIGPEWLDSAGYDIDAKGAAGTENQAPQMLQALLADQFKLVSHRDTRELPVYALVVAKSGVRMQKMAEGGTTGTTSSSRGEMIAQGVSMAKFANLLATPRFGLDHPVLDQTSLTDLYDFTLKWTPESPGEAQVIPEHAVLERGPGPRVPRPPPFRGRSYIPCRGESLRVGSDHLYRCEPTRERY